MFVGVSYVSWTDVFAADLPEAEAAELQNKLEVLNIMDQEVIFCLYSLSVLYQCLCVFIMDQEVIFCLHSLSVLYQSVCVCVRACVRACLYGNSCECACK